MPLARHAIVFVTPTDADTTLVDIGTGRHGYGHVALWSGIYSNAEPIVLDSSMVRSCVSFRPLEEVTCGMPYVTWPLDERLGEYMFRRAMRCVGKPYDYAGLIKTRVSDDAFTCSGLVCRAMPAQLDRQCRKVASTLTFKTVSPNAIAIALGVPKWTAA